MSNPLAGQGASPKGAEQAMAAISEGRRIGAKTFEVLAQRYPTDDEARIFFALYNAGTQSQADQTYAAYLKSAAILEAQLGKYSDHPGVAHYLIHSYDAPPIADKGLSAARRYSNIAPDALCVRTGRVVGSGEVAAGGWLVCLCRVNHVLCAQRGCGAQR